MRLLGQDVTNAPPRVITELGTGYIPEDRQRDGLVLAFPVMDNLILRTYYKPPFAHGRRMEWEAVRQHAEILVKQYDIRTPNVFTQCSALSGVTSRKLS